MKSLNKDLAKMPVQIHPCRTCPFEGKEPLALEPEDYAKVLGAIVNLESQHLCHSAENKMLCRGGRNILLRVLCGYGFISEPTDTAFEAARNKALEIDEE